MGYTLAATASKRELIYENNRLVATEPYTIKYNKTTGIKTARVLVLSAPALLIFDSGFAALRPYSMTRGRRARRR